jgi:uncharacterized membrane protein YeaQ/YmgE (transglycosylase-associated protein family)
MTLPSFLLGILISSLYAAVFHLWKRGGLGRLLFYFIISWVGFWGGHMLADRLGWQFDSLGPLHLGTATLGSLVCLFIGYWLSLVESA